MLKNSFLNDENLSNKVLGFLNKKNKLITNQYAVNFSEEEKVFPPTSDPGEIIKAISPIINPLDPNGDGWITLSGTQFSGTNERDEFEIPFITILQDGGEPDADLQTGSSCGKTDIIDNPNTNSDAGYYYISDPDNIPDNGDELILFRMRIAEDGSGAYGYSFLFDTDNKFGFTGSNTDVNAVTGNPGFEKEVILSTGGSSAGINVLNVDGVTSGVLINNYSRSTNEQRSVALHTDNDCSGTPIFLDFYVPLSDLGITVSSAFNIVFATSSSPATALGGSASDIGGVDGLVILTDDEQFLAAVEAQNPTDTDNDGITDIEEGTGDRDGDGVPNNEDLDPQGYFYNEATGEIISGGSVSVSGPGAVNLIDDGSSGQYQWTVTTMGTYTMTVTAPSGYNISTTCLAQDPPAYDPTGNTNPDSLGSGENASTGFLMSNTCTAYYLTFDLDVGDPLIINNNIPLTAIDPCTDGATAGMVTANDPDADGINNECDLDDDNDGILDENECGIVNSSFYRADFEGSDWDTYISAPTFTPNNTTCQNGIRATSQNTTPGGGFSLFHNTANCTMNVDDSVWGMPNPVTVLSNTDYTVSYNYLVSIAPVDLSLRINGVEIPVTEVVGGWQTFTTTWNSGTATSILVEIITKNASFSGNDFFLDDITITGDNLNCDRDTDGDGTPDRLDTDSDNDGCPDALEGGDGFNYSDLVSATDLSLGGTVASSGVNIGIPMATSDGDGQTIGTSQDASQQAAECDPCDASSELFVDSDGDTIGDACDLDDDNDGILDVNETNCGSIVVAGKPTTLNGAAITAQTSVSNNDVIRVADVVSTVDGIDVDMIITVDNITSGLLYEPSTAKFSLTPFNPTADDYFKVIITFVEAGTTTSVELEEFTMVAIDIDSGANENFTELVGFSSINSNVTIGSSLTVQPYENGGGPGGYVNYGLRQDLVGTTTNWTQEGSSLDSDINHWVTATYGNSSSFSFAFGVTGGTGLLTGARGFFISDMTYCAEKDTDGDGTPDRLDTDSDNDGCPDVLEGSDGFNYSDLVSATDLSLGDAVATSGANIGIPIATSDGDGQTMGTSQDASQQAAECDPCDASSELFVDTDGDTVGNACDLDDDNDGILDINEMNCATNINAITPTVAGSTASYLTASGEAAFDITYTNVSGNSSLFGYNGIMGIEASAGNQLSYDFSTPIHGLVMWFADLEQQEWVHINMYDASGARITDLTPYVTANVIATSAARTITNNVIYGLEIDVLATTFGESTDENYVEVTLPFGISKIEVYFHETANPSRPGSFVDGTPEYFIFNGCAEKDTDEDGIPDSLDLDSDGDSCPDALEAAGNFSASNLVNSSINGGNTGGTFNGDPTAGPVTQNLGNVVNVNGIPTAVTGGSTSGTETTGQNTTAAVTNSSDKSECQVDLSLTKTVDRAIVKVGDTITFKLKINNNGPVNATGVQVSGGLAPGLSYVSDNSLSTSTTFVGNTWNVGNIASGQTIELEISAIVTGAGTLTSVSQITQGNTSDSDSTPNNGN